MKKLQYTLLAVVAAILFTSCEKVSPIGVLVAGTGVEDRVKMSNIYFKQHIMDYKDLTAPEDADEYTFLVGADSHVTDDAGRMDEMFSIGIEGKDLLYAHLGDIADTKAEYYINLDNSIQRAKEMYADKFYKKEVVEVEGIMYTKYTDTLNNKVYFDTEDVPLPFFPVVGNHDITHNGWALWSSLFHSSFYEVYVLADITSDDTYLYDHFIFLDTASGTLGREQVELIEQGVFDSMYDQETGMKTRHTFIFSHTNIFRPRAVEFASTFAREEMFFLLDKFAEWNASMVFLGHVHKWDYEKVNGVEYLTLDSMCEANNPNPGDYLVRVHCKKDGTITWERVRMNYTKKR